MAGGPTTPGRSRRAQARVAIRACATSVPRWQGV